MLALRTSGHTSLLEAEQPSLALALGVCWREGGAAVSAVFGEECQSFPDRLINIHYSTGEKMLSCLWLVH